MQSTKQTSLTLNEIVNGTAISGLFIINSIRTKKKFCEWFMKSLMSVNREDDIASKQIKKFHAILMRKNSLFKKTFRFRF